jgi:WD40 repeat protein/serine/threonine protein kinase/tetratricopeptide (TPR) repeat protein
VALPSAERPAYLAVACGDDQKLRQRVEALLRAHDAPEGFLPEKPAVHAGGDSVSTSVLAASLTEQLGDTVGRYKLREKLGEGGCGVVYLAEQEEPVRRKVALKIIKLGMDTKQVVARFEAERQALALMDHPNIAQFFDAGVTGDPNSQLSTPNPQLLLGRPYFVMELVGGVKITDYCEQNQLDTRQRLDLFIQVCRAIQHAHQKGVIHRDIKPSNVLVAMQDGAPVPKVIDFGIAKATQGRLIDQTVFTAFEQFLGTPAYMSPEQAQLGSLDVDTRSDIYSLGVLLYELLTGKTPFDSKELLAQGLDAMRRTIQEKEPPTPSTRLKQELAARSECPDMLDTNTPDSTLDKDLDWIVMKCLEKDRARRYETANGLARDIERHLSNEPVIARPPSRLYEFQKTVRRHKLGFAATAAVIVVLLLGIGGVFFEWRRAERHATMERSERNRAESVLAQNQAIELRRAEDYYEAGDRRSMLPHLALVLRQNPSNRIAAERLFSTLSHRNWARLACPPLMHSNRVTSAMFSRDGKWVVSSAADNTAWVWDASTGQPVAGPFVHQAEINDAEFSPDGQLVVTASDDQSARVWDAKSGRPITDALPHPAKVELARFSPDGKVLATLCDDRAARIWDARSGRSILKPLRHGDGPPQAHFLKEADFSPDGMLLATAAMDGQVWVWNCQTGEPAMKLEHGAPGTLCVRFSPDGRMLATSLYTNTTLVWNLASSPPQAISLRHNAICRSVEFSLDGQRVVTASHDNTAQVWDAVSGKPIGPPLTHGHYVACAMFSPEGLRIATASSDQTVRVWDAESGEPLTEPINVESGAFYAQFHPDGQRVLTVSNGKAVLIWDVSLAPPLTLYSEQGVWTAEFSPDAKSLILGTSFSDIRLRDVFSGKVLSNLGEKSFCVRCAINDIAFSPDGGLAVVAADGGAFAIFDLSSGKQISPVRALHDDHVVSGRFSHDSGKIVTASWDRTAVVWEALTGKPLTAPLRHPSRLKWAEFSPNDQFVLTTSEDAVARIWDVQDGTLIRELKHDGEVNSAHFNSDGTRVVTASSDLTARTWDTHDGKLIGILTHAMAVRSALFSPNGQLIVTAMGGHGDLRLWDALTCKPLTGPFGESSATEFSLDGKRLILHSAGRNYVEIRDALDGQRLSETFLHSEMNRFSHLSSDGRFVIAGTTKGARIWEAPEASLPVPDWLPDLAEALAGQRFNQKGVLEPIGPSELWAVQRRMMTGTIPDSLYSQWAKWFLADGATRTVLPSSRLTLRQHAQSLAEQRVSFAAAKEALLLQPTNVTAMSAVASTTSNAFFGDWLGRHAAELASESEEVLWERETFLRDHGRSEEALGAMERGPSLWAHNPWIWKDKGEALEKLGRFEEAHAAYSRSIDLSRNEGGLRISVLEARWRLLRRMNRLDEAQRDFLEAKRIPLRAALTSNSRFTAIDLRPHLNTGLQDLALAGVMKATNSTASLCMLAGVEFELCGYILLDGKNADPDFPSRMSNIQIRQRCRALHFLQCCDPVANRPSGSAVGSYVVHYAWAADETIPIIGNQYVRWWSDIDKEFGEATEAWRGQNDNGDIERLFKLSWTNPHPELEIERIDFIASGPGRLLLFAITGER